MRPRNSGELSGAVRWAMFTTSSTPSSSWGAVTLTVCGRSQLFESKVRVVALSVK